LIFALRLQLCRETFKLTAMEMFQYNHPYPEERLLEISSQIDAFEQYEYAHGLRIAEIAEALARAVGLSGHDRAMLRSASLLHDIGEMAMNRSYISQDRKLNDIELLDMRRHPIVGELEVTKLGFGTGVQLLIRWHHEWWNGEGYPDRLSGSSIPLGARILRLADCFASMTDRRPGRKAYSPTEAAKYVGDAAGLEFDPAISDLFLKLRLYEAPSTKEVQE
jgi:putative nucleotidyltransferase with HDIG domain